MHRAAKPTIPDATPQQQRALAEQGLYHRQRGDIERRRQLRTLAALAFLVIAGSIARAGTDRIFPPNWWRLW